MVSPFQHFFAEQAYSIAYTKKKSSGCTDRTELREAGNAGREKRLAELRRAGVAVAKSFKLNP